MKITLKNNKGFKWFKTETLFFKGYFYHNDFFYEKENALNFLSELINIHQFKENLPKLNGIFTILKKHDNQLFIVNDVTRSFPVFYTYCNNSWFFSDDIINIKKEIKVPIFDDLASLEFKASNHVHGSKTLIKNIYQTQASEYLIFKNDKIKERAFYFSYSIDTENTKNYKLLEANCIQTFENSFERCIKSLNNKTVVVPLSGGFDSRLIAVMLKKYHYKNVVCYTYGSKNSFEIENSKKTAKALNFKWYFIEYKKELTADFLNTTTFKEYAHFAGKLASMPNLQEYFAVNYLKDNKLIPENSIFIPGYAGDILGGSEYLSNISKNIKSVNLAENILLKKMTNYSFTKDEKNQLKTEIDKNLNSFDHNFKEKIPETVFDDYNLKERIAKFIFNSASYYTFFNFEVRFPFWDKELLDFFKNLPINLKRNKTFFDAVLINYYFKPFGVVFEKENQPDKKQIELQKIKNQLKPFLPTFIKQKILQKNDWNNYQPITTQMFLQMKKNKQQIKLNSKDYNEIITQWYLYFSKNNLK